MRIGLFGGTFNPIHNGHITVAGEVRALMRLAKIIFIPALTPPHKNTTALARAEDRYEMIRRAIAGNPGFDISDLEMKRPGPSYTIDTVRHFKKQVGAMNQIFLIMGVDAFTELDTWKSYRQLLCEVSFGVMARPAADAAGDCIRVVGDFLKSRISAEYRCLKYPDRFEHPKLQPVFIAGVSPVPISSTDVRQRIQNGESINNLVPEAVRTYIQQKGLYS
ncbi:MAG: nicotinate (nicotinamide) nucleotide adenylyltransferase [Desulfobacteraceae bacterium]|nr:nicotinate (nicotinamide) nucleotide adenylyltransferase [Desulfobacteraceae bacterium]